MRRRLDSVSLALHFLSAAPSLPPRKSLSLDTQAECLSVGSSLSLSVQLQLQHFNCYFYSQEKSESSQEIGFSIYIQLIKYHFKVRF